MRPEFPEPEDIFDRADALEHRRRHQARMEEMRARNEQIERIEAEHAAERKANADDLTRRANQSVLLHEYTSLGLRAPFTGFDGIPTVSLSWLLREGWSIQKLGEHNVLVKPATVAAAPRKSRADYDGSQ